MAQTTEERIAFLAELIQLSIWLNKDEWYVRCLATQAAHLGRKLLGERDS